LAELSERVAPYLTWRFCYLLCGLFFGLGQVVMSRLALDEAKTYDFLAAQLPPSVSVDSFKNLLAWLNAEGQVVWALAVVSFLLQFLGTLTAMPMCALTWGRFSRRCVWCAWLTTFLPPFLLFLSFPMRLLVDWDRVTADVCVFSVQNTFKMPGGSFSDSFRMATRYDLLDAGIQGLSDGPDEWCLSKGAGWYDSFFNATVACIWSTEDVCKDTFCLKAGTDASACLQSCMGYALPQVSAAQKQQMLQGFGSCVSNLKEFTLGPPPALPAQTSKLTPDNVVQLYDRLIYTQRQAIVEGSLLGHQASLHAEVAVGMLIGLMAAKYLGFSSLALLGGLGEALLNLKAVFPASPQGGWLLILTTVQVVPVYALLLAVIQQLIGDELLAVACFLMMLVLSLGILTGIRILKLQDSERQLLYKKVWMEYGLRAVLGLTILVVLYFWSARRGFQDALIQYLKQDILTPKFMIAGVLEYYAKKIMNAVAGTDVVMVAFVQSEAWIDALPHDELSAHRSCTRDFKVLLVDSVPAVNPDATSAFPDPEKVGNQSQ